MPTSTNLITVLVVGYSLPTRGIRAILNSDSGFEMLESASGLQKHAVSAAQRLKPRLIVYWRDPRDDLEFLRQLHRAAPSSRILTLTADVHHDTVFQTLRAGAHRCIPKNCNQEQLRIAARALARGETALPPLVALRLLAYADERRPAVVAPLNRPRLTDDQRKVLDLRAVGQTEDEISTNTGLSVDAIRGVILEALTVAHQLDRQDRILAGQGSLPIPLEWRGRPAVTTGYGKLSV